jgi:hypothetical protein
MALRPNPSGAASRRRSEAARATLDGVVAAVTYGLDLLHNNTERQLGLIDSNLHEPAGWRNS